MSEHISTQEMDELVANGSSYSRLVVAGNHLRHCSLCLNRLQSLPSARKRFAELEFAFAPSANQHLDYPQLEGFVDRSLSHDEYAGVERHIAACPECLQQIEELRELSPTETVVVLGGTSFSDSVRAMFAINLPAFGLAAICIAALLGLSVWMLSRNNASEQVADANVNRPTNEQQQIVSQAEIPPAAIPEDASPVSGPEAKSPNRELVVSLGDGNRIVGIDASGDVVGYQGLSAKLQGLVKQALRNGSLRPGPGVGELSAASDPLMGSSAEGNSFKIKGPVGEVLATDKPTLSWQPLTGSDSYRVDVYDSGFKKVASSGELRFTTWSTRLRRGKTYSWQVTAIKDGQEYKSPQAPAPEARFRIINDEHFAEINLVRTRYPGSHLLLSIAYAEAGLRKEAAKELRIVAQQNRGSSLPQRLIDQLNNEK